MFSFRNLICTAKVRISKGGTGDGSFDARLYSFSLTIPKNR